ncbi:MAG: hypothetical protein ACJASM_002046 [Salibacteraceae bacterium]|jgi:hypothetical protein
MAKITLEQENGDIAMMVRNLLSVSSTNLTKVCDNNGLEYGPTSKKINAKRVDLEYLQDLIKKINPDAKMYMDTDISLYANGRVIFNQK